MKTIILFRHGKSDWNAPFDTDASRPLKKRGRKASRRMGEFLKLIHEEPDLIITSPAVRAKQTIKKAAKAGRWNADVIENEALYEDGADGMWDALALAPDDLDRIMLVGHEPAMSDFAAQISGGGSVRFPTAAMIRIDVAAEQWRDIGHGEGELIWLMPPRMLKRIL